MRKTFESPFGLFYLQVNDGAIVQASFEDFPCPPSRGSPTDAKAFMDNVLAYCSMFSICPNGSVFQKKTWDCISSINPGHTRSYKEIAKKIGNPNATRAVGSAIARNPIAYVIPCHRVIRSNGHAGGYRWNPARKIMMLEYEKLNLDE